MSGHPIPPASKAQGLQASFFQPRLEAWPGGPQVHDVAGQQLLWQRWVKALSDCGVRRLVVQCVAHLDLRILPQPDHDTYRWLLDPPAADAVGLRSARQLMDAAVGCGMVVDAGLSLFIPQCRKKDCKADATEFETEAWDDLSQNGSLTTLDRALERALAVDLALAAQWNQAFGADPPHPAWRGWYLANEFDDIAWRDAARRDRWVRHHRALCDGLRAIDGSRPIAASGFCNPETSHDVLRQQWQVWAAEVPVDEWMFQDGIGAKGHTLESADAAMTVVAEAVRAAGRRFTPIVELFRSDMGAATVDEVEARLQVAGGHVEPGADASSLPGWVCFELPTHVLADDPRARSLKQHFSAGGNPTCG
jgi:hypothetical protein